MTYTLHLFINFNRQKKLNYVKLVIFKYFDPCRSLVNNNITSYTDDQRQKPGHSMLQVRHVQFITSNKVLPLAGECRECTFLMLFLKKSLQKHDKLLFLLIIRFLGLNALVTGFLYFYFYFF